MEVLYFNEKWSWNGDLDLLNKEHLKKHSVLIEKDKHSMMVRLEELESPEQEIKQ